jgi:hypothetical protein
MESRGIYVCTQMYISDMQEQERRADKLVGHEAGFHQCQNVTE